MDPLWAVVAEFWWIGPTLVGAGTLGVIGLRQGKAGKMRKLAVHAAQHDVRAARMAVLEAKAAVKVARAEVLRMQVTRDAGYATAAQVAAARRGLQSAQREARAASAAVRAGRAQLAAARAALPSVSSDPATLPLARLMAAHDAVRVRWLEYETDPAKLIAFPTMSDVRAPLTVAYLDQQRRTEWLRPASADTKMQPAEYVAYRDAVSDLGRAFEAAEADAWRQARASGNAPAGGPPPSGVADWRAIAQQAAQEALDRATDAVGRMFPPSPRNGAAPPAPHAAGSETPSARSAADAQAAPASAAGNEDEHTTPDRGTRRIWPVPSRRNPRGT